VKVGKLIKKLMFSSAMVFFFSCSEHIAKDEYSYASPEAWDHCQNLCPGSECLCVLGPGFTWYLSPEIGDTE